MSSGAYHFIPLTSFMILDYVRTIVCVTCYFTTYEVWYIQWGDTNIRKYKYSWQLMMT